MNADVFLGERARLRSLAYRMLGSITEADDVVQDAWVRWQRMSDDDRAAVERPGAWFSTTVSRLALDRLGSARVQRETYVGPWLPEPVFTDDLDPTAAAVELTESLTIGFLAVLERLAPVERAVFLLADVFDEPYAEIASLVGRSEDACRQIASRARRRVREERPQSFRPAAAHGDDLLRSFVAACVSGSYDDFRRVLADDVVLVSDGGAGVHAARRPVVGFPRVSRFLVTITRKLPADVTVELHSVNAEPGLLARRNGVPWYVLSLETTDAGISRIHLMVNPEKLVSLGELPVP